MNIKNAWVKTQTHIYTHQISYGNGFGGIEPPSGRTNFSERILGYVNFLGDTAPEIPQLYGSVRKCVGSVRKCVAINPEKQQEVSIKSTIPLSLKL